MLTKQHGKFGVNLYYDETDESVYVGDVEDNSPADLSGKIMVGDQIVQVGLIYVDVFKNSGKGC